MAKKTSKKAVPKKRAPQDLTQYALRGIKRRLSDLEARVTRLERLEMPAPATHAMDDESGDQDL